MTEMEPMDQSIDDRFVTFEGFCHKLTAELRDINELVQKVTEAVEDRLGVQVHAEAAS